MTPLISILQDAAASPEAWPEALEAFTDAAGVAGAALIVSNKRTGGVDDACFSGLSAEFKSDYVNHYAAVDPYSPLLEGKWLKLSDCLPDAVLRKSEWYNDFVLTCGIRDILGMRLVDTTDHRAIFGIHQQIGRSFSDKLDTIVGRVSIPLKHAAFRHVDRIYPTRSDPFDADSRTSSVERSRFYFHINNGSCYPDEAGSIFPTSENATQHAINVARELAQHDSWHGFSVLVTDSRGREIARVPIG
ncbi:MAG TPA: hypothetical protein VFR21_30640 [Bradyrhizobium sp.]|nr:hypothetical protein [Bradyrhizobium sp.]